MKPLAVVYRPQTFEDVVEQDTIKKILQNQIDSGTVKNAYLFCGSAGCGKTTNAYLFARYLNGCNDNITDLDAASHSGVDDVRSIIEDSRYKPIGTPYRIFIIDEAHALSDKAWQAFLLTLEEPTPSSVFIFCTTDPQKIPATILSRAQRFDFQKITQSGIVNRLKYIIKCENEKGCDYTYTDDALEYIAKLAEGGMRSAITFMETAMGLSKDLTIDSVVASLGTISYRTMFDLTKSVCRMDKKESIQIIETAYASGTDLKRFIRDFSDFVLDLCKYDLFRDFEWLHIPPMYKEELEAFGKEDYAFFTQLLNEMLNLSNNIKYDPTPKPTVESVFILLCSEA